MTDKTENGSLPEPSPDLLEQREREEIEQQSLGIAGRLACIFIDSPVSPLLMMAALAIGLLGLMFTPRQEDPQISVPMIDIFVQYPGASAAQVTSLVTEPLERIMHEIPGVRHVYSATERGRSMVTVRFLVGEQLGPSIVKVHDKLASHLDQMPPGVQMPPLVKATGIDDVPVVALTLWSDHYDPYALRRIAAELRRELARLDQVSEIQVTGGQRRARSQHRHRQDRRDDEPTEALGAPTASAITGIAHLHTSSVASSGLAVPTRSDDGGGRGRLCDHAQSLHDHL